MFFQTSITNKNNNKTSVKDRRDRMNLHQLVYSPLWNIFLITAGCVIYSIGAKSIVLQHNFIVGGLFGSCLLIYYKTHLLSPGLWFLLLNIPIFALSRSHVSKRFFLYSLYSMAAFTLSFELINFDLGVKNQLYAAIAGGVICGTGGGIILRSLGSGGGLDIIAVILNRKYNLGIGKFYVVFNAILFFFGFFHLSIDLCIASLILVFISSVSLEYILSLFNQRKMVYIISDKNKTISKEILDGLSSGATFIKATGAYTRKDKDILMTITNNIQLKRLEEKVFTIDPGALFIVENTFNVLGSTFGKRKTL
jgi:uncharacterized membrane-anchored protein YitT (DUF2179 family)